MEDLSGRVPALGVILRAAWATTRSNLLSIALITLMIKGPLDFFSAVYAHPDDASFAETARDWRLRSFLQFWFGTLCDLGVVCIVVAYHRGLRPTVHDALRRASWSYPRALWATILYGAGLVIGLVLLVVPAVIFAVLGVFSLQAIVVHGETGWAALKRSYRTVKGRWWAFFSRLAVLWLLALVAAFAVAAACTPLPQGLLIEFLTSIPFDFIAAFLIVCVTTLYLLSGGADDVAVSNASA